MTAGGEDVVDGRAWAAFCDTLKAAGDIVLQHSESEIDRVEGFRYLSRLARGGLESFVERGQTAWPVLSTIPYQLKIGCDNPDAHYQSVNVDPRHRYRLHGSRGTIAYLGIGAYSGGFGQNAGAPGRQGYLEDNDADPSRTIDIVASVERPTSLEDGQRWLELGPKTTMIAVRQFYLDRLTEQPAELQIDCLDPPSPAPPPLTPQQLGHALGMAGLFVHGVARRFVDWVEDDFVHRPNTLDFLKQQGEGAGAWADPNQRFRHGYWTLGPEEALVVEVPPIECRYWNFQLNNLWEESLDYRFLSVTVNKHTARYEPDGSARIVIAHEDPGVGNWMDTAGHVHGTMGLRYNQVAEDIPPACRVVTLAGLRS